MITIREDKSYLVDLDLKAIEHGYAELGVHSLRISAALTEEEKAENARMSKVLSRDEWNRRCEEHKQDIAGKIEEIVDAIQNYSLLTIYQYKDENVSYTKDDWDLFFWCNRGDMSHVRLSPNKKRTCEGQLETIGKTLELIKGIDVSGVGVAVQYTALYNEEKVRQAVQLYCEKNEGTFIDYAGMTGKIVKTGELYCFKKKRARTSLFNISAKYVLRNILNG